MGAVTIFGGTPPSESENLFVLYNQERRGIRWL